MNDLTKECLTEINISTVADNLRNTIKGKEQYLESVQEEYKTSVGVDRAVLHSTQAFLAINIDELKRILQDVEQCIGVEL